MILGEASDKLHPGRWTTLCAGTIVALAALAAYHNCFSVPFVLTDELTIGQNPTIQRLWSLDVLSPPVDMPVGGRPVINISFAINYALNGEDLRGYHALNLLVHVCAALTLLGVLRRTLLSPALRARFGNAAGTLAFAMTLLWTLHPLQTESVTYLTQRAESILSLFYLLTLYCFIRGAGSRKPRAWYSLSVVACLLGMASKETMISAPLIALLYDRTFLAGSFREAWRRRRGVYFGLAATWLLLAYLVVAGEGRGSTAGFGTQVTWWAYALTQCRAIPIYLKLAAWPSPLILFYGRDVVTNPADVGVRAAILLLLLAATAIALWRWPAAGFAGAVFFAVLAPSSSVVPIWTQPMAEHRMYLVLAALIALAVLGLHAVSGGRTRLVLIVCLIWAALLGWMTARRNEDYQSELVMWSDVTAKLPNSWEAQLNLGAALHRARRFEEAIGPYRKALQAAPNEAGIHFNLGTALARSGRVQEGIAEIQEAFRLDPTDPDSHFNLGNILADNGRTQEAIAQYREVLRLNPDYVEAQERLDAMLGTNRGRQPNR